MQGGLGSLAVRTLGSGALRGVRIINLLRGTLFWFKVDSAVPAANPIKQEPAVSRVLDQQTIKQEVCPVMDKQRLSRPLAIRFTLST